MIRKSDRPRRPDSVLLLSKMSHRRTWSTMFPRLAQSYPWPIPKLWLILTRLIFTRIPLHLVSKLCGYSLVSYLASVAAPDSRWGVKGSSEATFILPFSLRKWITPFRSSQTILAPQDLIQLDSSSPRSNTIGVSQQGQSYPVAKSTTVASRTIQFRLHQVKSNVHSALTRIWWSVSSRKIAT